MKKEKAVVVTTEYRGIFFGYVIDDKKVPEKIVLKNARMCVSFSSTHRGVMGLSSVGPNDKCKVSFAVPKFTAWKITAVLECSDEAVRGWEAQPWS